MSVRLAGESDRPAILSLLSSSHKDAVSEQDRSKQGFVQGHWNEDTLAAFAEGPGIFVAEEKDAVAAVVLTSDADDPERLPGPARRTVEMTRNLPGPILLYGPVVVDPKYRGRGLVRTLLSGIALTLGQHYPTAVLFVENTNERSLEVHRGLGMTKHAKFTLDDRKYTIFTFSPKDFSPRRVR